MLCRLVYKHTRAISLMLALLLWSSTLFAQLNRGTITGLVTDPQGAVVPNADVVINSTDTGIQNNTKTNSSGYYRVGNLVPGPYSATFNARGFSRTTVGGIQIVAGQTSRIDATLKLGEARQTVQVTAAAALLQTAPSNASTTLGENTVQQIPLAGRDLQQLVYLVPGVNPVSGPPGSNFGFNSQFGSFPDPTHALGSDVSVNGGQGGANAWYLDGNLNLSSFAENIAVNPSPDAVEQFQVITNAFSPEYGRTGGAVFNVVLKSGTNQFHGDIYEFLRNSALNARNPFTSIDSLGRIVPQDQLRFNNFGGTLGGPVVLPHLYNGKNRTFFFFSWDTSILHLMGNKVYTVPTPLMKTGDFSEDPNVAQFGMWNPLTTVGPDSQGLFQRTAFGTPVAGNPYGADGCLNTSVEAGAASGIKTCNFATQLPNGMLNPTAMFFVNSFPTPNYLDPLSSCPLAQGGQFRICDNYLGTNGSSQDSNNLSIKIDHQMSAKSKLFGEWLYNPGQYRNYRVPWTGPTFPQDSVGFGSQYNVDFRNQIIALGNTYIFSPSVVNEFRASFSRQFLTTNPTHPYPDSITSQSQVQKVLAPLNIPEDPSFPVPNWSMSTPAGGNISFGPTTWVNMETAAEAYTILDNVTKVLGKHTFKTGFMYRLEHTAYNSGFPTGFGSGGELVADPNSGQGGGSGLAQFMLGMIASGGRGSYTGLMWKPYERFRSWGLYAQDEWHVKPNFTVDLGVRYDVNGYMKTRQEPLSNFCLSCANDTTGLPGKVIYVGDPQWPGGGQDIAPPNWNSVGPRVNFAWTPFSDKKTVIRGGYDIFYSNALASINSPGQSAANAPGWNQEYDWNGSWNPAQCGPGSGECPAWLLSDTATDKRTLTTPQMPQTFPAQQHAPLLGLGLIQFFTPPSHDPMVQSWSFEIERELPDDMMLSIGYVGTHGTHLVGEPFRQFNYIHTADLLKYKTAINSVVPISQFYSGKTAAALAQVYGAEGILQQVNGQPALPLTILLKQYPFYGAISSLQDNTAFDGTSIYHGLNVRFQKRMRHGLNFNVAYTWSKQIDNASTGQMAAMLVDPIHWARAGNIGGRAGAGLSGGFGGSFQNPDNRAADRAIAATDIPQLFNIASSYELPFGSGKAFVNRNGLLNGAIGGWRISGTFNAESGVPLGIGCPGDQVTSRCDLIGNPNFSGSRSKQQQIADWINPAAFQPAYGSDQSFWANYDPTDPRAWQFGTMGPRMSNLRSPGFWNIDLSLGKDFHISESKYFEFRWEAFNALNHQNLGVPNTGFCLPPTSNGSTDSVHQAGCQFGRITNIQTDPRSQEFALKFFW